jgi:glycogen phosphorylase
VPQQSLQQLSELANNLWWSWDADATALWEKVDAWRWRRSRFNPVALLADLDPERATAIAADRALVQEIATVHQRFEAYLRGEDTWAVREGNHTKRIAYVSMEFGIHASIRLYSGGLGVLAGDHLRSASDLGLNMVGIGLLYRQGYFRQVIDGGHQVPAYPEADFDRLPYQRATMPDGRKVVIAVPIEGRQVIAQVFRLEVGRITLYLLDTDHAGNRPEDRELTRHLYGGDAATRIKQEVLLGLGGEAILRELVGSYDVVHLNEGHCAFVPVAMAAQRLRAGDTWNEALTWARERCVFTTHTPVPAGHDRFPWALVDSVLGPWRTELGLPQGAFMDLGRAQPGDWNQTLCMTVLALRLATCSNGVSKLHGEVSRTMWQELWPKREAEEVPIGHITNGVHPIFWMAPEMRTLLDQELEGWRDHWGDNAFWAGARGIDTSKLWDVRNALRRRLIDEVAASSGVQLDPDALTIGFARRFAPYKRGDLVFSDPDRLAAILDRGVQILYSGKAHPQDGAGKAIVERVVRLTDQTQFRGRVVFLEDYDMRLGHLLTSGCDVWLNNPRRPREASGTSGQKVTLNGGLNLSVLDGWWPEGFDGVNGWAIGTTTNEPDDKVDAESLYNALEQSVLPDWEARSDGLPTAWMERVVKSMEVCVPRFNSHRMVRDYVQRVYAAAWSTPPR